MPESFALPLPSRRRFLAGALAAIPALPARAQNRAPPSDQTARFQALIDGAARSGNAALLPPGRWRVSQLILPDGCHLVGAPGTRLVQSGSRPALAGARASRIRVENLVLEGAPDSARDGALARFEDVADLRLDGVRIEGSPGTGLALERCGGAIRDGHIEAVRTAIFSRDATGLAITGNRILDCADNGILVWRGEKGFDGTQVLANRIERVRAESGGSGENGNAINVFRASGVTVAQNQIRDAAFSAVRNNAGDDVQIVQNQASAIGEVALYCEFGFVGGLVHGNVVDGAATGISCTNFNEGGRLASVIGNLIRNLFRRPDALSGAINRGIGIAAEADAALVGNVVENAPAVGILLGYGPHLRDVLAQGNLVRASGVGIGVSVAPGAGHATVMGNTLAECRDGAIVGFAWEKRATGDLARDATGRPATLTIAGNTVR